jgi:hypothetical protein
MNLLDVVKRIPVPKPYSEGEKIPWDDPEFSARMLKYHLSQDHDAASRRFNIIDQHVKFMDGLVYVPVWPGSRLGLDVVDKRNIG